MSETRPRIAILGAGPTGIEAALAAAESGLDGARLGWKGAPSMSDEMSDEAVKASRVTAARTASCPG